MVEEAEVAQPEEGEILIEDIPPRDIGPGREGEVTPDLDPRTPAKIIIEEEETPEIMVVVAPGIEKGVNMMIGHEIGIANTVKGAPVQDPVPREIMFRQDQKADHLILKGNEDPPETGITKGATGEMALEDMIIMEETTIDDRNPKTRTKLEGDLKRVEATVPEAAMRVVTVQSIKENRTVEDRLMISQFKETIQRKQKLSLELLYPKSRLRRYQTKQTRSQQSASSNHQDQKPPHNQPRRMSSR